RATAPGPFQPADHRPLPARHRPPPGPDRFAAGLNRAEPRHALSAPAFWTLLRGPALSRLGPGSSLHAGEPLAPVPARPGIDSGPGRAPAPFALAAGQVPHRSTGRPHFPLSALSQTALDRSLLRRPPLPTMPGPQEPAVAPPPAAQLAPRHVLSLRLHL